MPTLIVDPHEPAPASIARAAALLRDGRLVAFPTETVYGLGAHALDPRAVRRIFDAKGRPSSNPLIVHVASASDARALASRWPTTATALARAFWPGPLTLVVPRIDRVPREVTAGLDSVALRVPSHPVALALIRAAGLPVAAPSANRSTEVSPTTARHVERALGDAIDLILDGGPTTVGIESTVVDLRGERPAILRPGVLSADDIAGVVGALGEASDGTEGGDDGGAYVSPGQMEKHYSPRARLLIRDGAAGEIIREAAALRAQGTAATALVRGAAGMSASDAVRVLPADAAGYARELYAALHALDDAGCAVILVEAVPNGVAWDGVRDRLARAASV